MFLRFYRLKNDYLKGRTDGNTLRSEAKDIGVNTVVAVNWLRKFAEDCGDHPPNESGEKRELPACYTKRAVYSTYKEENENENVSESYFLKIWKQYCSHISISTVTLSVFFSFC